MASAKLEAQVALLREVRAGNVAGVAAAVARAGVTVDRRARRCPPAQPYRLPDRLLRTSHGRSPTSARARAYASDPHGRRCPPRLCADVNVLHLAVWRNDLEIAQVLLEAGASTAVQARARGSH